jgi:hypothetical protein
MLASFLFLVLGIAFGFTLLRLIKNPLSIIEQFFWGMPIGIMLLTAWTFAWALLLPNQDYAIVFASFTAALPVFYYFNKDMLRAKLISEIVSYKKRVDRGELWSWALVIVPTLIYTIITIPYLMFFRDGNLLAGWINTWGDWAVHLRNSTFFAGSDKLSLENPLFSGSTFHYPYLSSYLSGLLQRFDLSIDRSLTWPTFALFASLPPILYSFGNRILKHRAAGVLFTYLVLLAGGMGIYYLAHDVSQGVYFWEANAYSPKLYTDFRIDGQYSNDGIWFMNFIISELLPQRAFLSGLGIALFVLLTAWQNSTVAGPAQAKSYWLRLIKQPGRNHLFLAGLLFGILPLLHTHSFVALGIIVPVLFAYRIIASLLAKDKIAAQNSVAQAILILGPATLLGFGLLFTFVFDSSSTGTFVHGLNWWVPNPEQPFNPLTYWLRNAGPLIVVGIACFLRKDRTFHPLLIAGTIIFIVCNFISFQPWHYDNLKILTYWYLLWALPIAYAIMTLPRQWVAVQIVAIILFTGAGLADVTSLQLSTRTGLQLSSQDDLQFARLVKQITAQDTAAIFIAATNHDNPLSIASGRKLYVGYEGWLWTYGIDANDRLEEVHEMYTGSTRGQELVRRREISYIALGPQELSRYKPNVEQLEALYPVVVEYKNYKLLKTN